MKRIAALRAVGLIGAAVMTTALFVGCSSSDSGNSGKSGPKKVSEIRVGLVFPTSGAMASEGQAQEHGVQVAIDWANKNGGIDGVPIKVVEGDTQSDPGAGATAAQRLIDQDNVSILIGSYSSGISQAMMPVAQRNDVILWEVGAVSPTINASGSPNFFRTVGGATTYSDADINFLTNFIAPKLNKDPKDVRIAITHEDGAFGSSVAEALMGAAKKDGLNVVMDQAYSSTSSDLTPLVLKLKQAKPDIVFTIPLVADTMLFWKAARTNNFNVPAIVGSAGYSSSTFVDTFGAKGVEGVFDVEAPAVAYMNSDQLDPKVSKLLNEWRKTFKEKYGQPCLVHCGDGLGGGYILVSDVLPRAIKEYGNANAKSIIKAADKTDIPQGGTPQGFGANFVKAGTKNTGGDNKAAKSYIMQWQNGKLNVVWPSKVASSKPTFPMPTWAER